MELNPQETLVEILRHKGIGPKGSKQLGAEDLNKIPDLIRNSSCSITTKITLLTAILLLDRTNDEERLVQDLILDRENLPKELHFLLTGKSGNDAEKTILDLIARIDLTADQAEKSVVFFMSNSCPEYYQAAYLEALRLKRETDLENTVFYKYFLNNIEHKKLKIDHLIEIGDSFDGVDRNPNFNIFTASVLGAMGYKVLLTGCETVAPKMGVTHHQILKYLGKNPIESTDKVIEKIEKYGFGYLDQSVFDNEMYSKFNMRKELVKRPFLATFEKILSPIVAENGNYVATSYTHAHYKMANIEIFKNSNFILKALNIKGLEGMVCPKSNISIPIVSLEKDKVDEWNFKCEGEFPTSSEEEWSVGRIANEGLDFLMNGTQNIAYFYVWNTVLMLVQGFSLEKEKDKIFQQFNNVVGKGEALRGWDERC